MTPDELLAAWHTQQTAFIEFRDLRLRAMLDVLAALEPAGANLRVLDLGCGPGSLVMAVAERFPEAEIVGLDRDPILLRLGRETNRFGQRVQLLDVDLSELSWVDQLGSQPFDAVLSATALHWLDPDELVRLYYALPQVLAPGAVFLNGDHMYYEDPSQWFIRQVAENERERFRQQCIADGAMTWEQWWQTARTMPGWEAEVELWEQRWATKHATPKVTAEFHIAALTAAGFESATQIYQWFDDHLIYARMPITPSPS